MAPKGPLATAAAAPPKRKRAIKPKSTAKIRYGCTDDNCNEMFATTAAWTRHETTHSKPPKWRCDVPDARSRLGVCAKVSKTPSAFERHLRRHQLDYDAVTKKLSSCQIGRNWQNLYWCGFCCVLQFMPNGIFPPWNVRMSHIIDHFENGWRIEQWYPSSGDVSKGERMAASLVSSSRNEADISSMPQRPRAPPRNRKFRQRWMIQDGVARIHAADLVTMEGLQWPLVDQYEWPSQSGSWYEPFAPSSPWHPDMAPSGFPDFMPPYFNGTSDLAPGTNPWEGPPQPAPGLYDSMSSCDVVQGHNGLASYATMPITPPDSMTTTPDMHSPDHVQCFSYLHDYQSPPTGPYYS